MSTYYEYKDVKVMIAHKLMNMDGWKVYGYHADQSDSMTDYYCQAYWDGVAEKNGYVLCVGVYGASKGEEIRKYNHSDLTYDNNIIEKIQKLKAMTVERGASEQEELSAKLMIEKLQKKAEETQENNNKYIVTGFKPAHMAHPPKCNWHIEKDGIIIAKGNGILKYASIDSYYTYSHYMKDIEDFKSLSKEDYILKYVKDSLIRNYYSDEEQAKQSAESHFDEMIKSKKLMDQFEDLINRFDTTCGCLVGEGELETYETIKVTEYKKENKVVECDGEIKEGQCFILKTGFTYGRRKGYVYRIHKTEYNDKVYYNAYKLDGKLKKECMGRATQSNHWSYIDEKFLKWIEKGSIAFCKIEEVSTPYEVEKVVRKTVKTDGQPKGQEVFNEDSIKPNLTYEVIEDTDTRDNTKIYVVKVKEKLSKEDYIILNTYMKSIGGYYSKFKHGFIFKKEPSILLNIENSKQFHDIQGEQNKQETSKEEQKKVIDYDIAEDKHNKSNKNIWIVKIKSALSKDDFAELKYKFATLKGFYSSLKSGFIFDYDPTDLLKSG